jgi:hypothetical protein
MSTLAHASPRPTGPAAPTPAVAIVLGSTTQQEGS